MAIATPVAKIERAVLSVTTKRVQGRKLLKSPRSAVLLLVRDMGIKRSGRACIYTDINRGVKWLKGGVRRLS